MYEQKSADGIVLGNSLVKASCMGRPEHEVWKGVLSFDGEGDTHKED